MKGKFFSDMALGSMRNGRISSGFSQRMTREFSNFIQKITYGDFHWFLVITHNRMKNKAHLEYLPKHFG